MTTAPVGKLLLLRRFDGLRQIPTIPAVLAPLLRYLKNPVEQPDMQSLTHLLAKEKSLATQCLQMANSPFFGRWQKVESLRGGVGGLGFQDISDIAMSCGVMNMLPSDKTSLDPVLFWEHSLGCALLCRTLARKMNLSDPTKAYLAGLLHDIGIIVNLWVLPHEFRTAFEIAKTQGIPLHEAEQRSLGFTHCETGHLLAEYWGLTRDIIEVVDFHHTPDKSSHDTGLVALVHIVDLLCRMSGLNYGYVEQRQVNLFEDSGFALLVQGSASVTDFDWARLTFELDPYMEDVRNLVRAIYRN